MTKEQYLKLFQNPYNQPDWELLLKELLPGTTVFPTVRELRSGNEAVVQIVEFGEYQTADRKKLKLFAVQLKDKKIARNRVGINKIIGSELSPGITDGALVVFFDTEQPEWRFSFLAKANIKGGSVIETSFQRFTYVFGTQETHRTAQHQFEDLRRSPKNLENFRDAFNVEQLSDYFFKGYKKQYEKFVLFLTGKVIEKKKGKWEEKQIQEPHPAHQIVFASDDKKGRDFLKKLLGRLVFLHFLQKKGWLGGRPQFLMDFFKGFEKKEKFHSIGLKALFFFTLNHDRKEDNFRFQVEGKDPFSEPCAIPYLNGGLFENDVPAAADLDFPEAYFQELLEFFTDYNFTIDENDPLEQEVGIDPEMLGRIFENLLEENRKKGTYYTPKEVVQYMCQESLIRYLAEDGSYRYEDLSELVVGNHFPHALESVDVARALNKKLMEVKICDPAIGSGAFPMGMLKELFECRRLLYSRIKTNEAFVPSEVKKQIIQNNLYGVDLDPGAVDIARLRFWLALVVDEETPSPLPNLDYKIMQGNSLLESFEGISLSVKSVEINEKGNPESIVDGQLDLMGRPRNGQLGLFAPGTKPSAFDEKGKKKIKLLADRYFSAPPDEKKEIKKKIDELVISSIREVIKEDRKKLEENKTSRMANYHSAKKSFDDAVKQVEALGKQQPQDNLKVQKLGLQLDKLEKDREAAAKEYHDGLDKEARLEASLANPEKPYFMWHLFFEEVFAQGGGFDILIGNPPYLRQEEFAELKPYLREAYPLTFSGTADLLVYFIEKGYSILRQGGILSYIVSNKWILAGYGQGIRTLLTDNQLYEIIDFGDLPVFGAIAYPCIIQIGRQKTYTETTVLKARAIPQKEGIRQQIGLLSFKIHTAHLDPNGWQLSAENSTDELERAWLNSVPLEHFINGEAKRGVLTGLSEAFVIKNEIVPQLGFTKDELEVVRPFAEGKGLKKYGMLPLRKSLIFFPKGFTKSKFGFHASEQKMIEAFPNIFRWLIPFKQKAIARSDKGDFWWELRACDYYELFSTSKIVYQAFQVTPCFTLDWGGTFFNNSMWFIPRNDLYLLGVLNSKAGWRMITHYCTPIQNGRQLIWDYLKKIPIPKVDAESKNKLNVLVGQILEAKKIGQEIKHLEDKIDALVYSFYGLNQDDIDRIEGRLVVAPPTPLPAVALPNWSHWIEEIHKGESKSLEFKSTLVWDIKESKKSPGMEHAILKTLAAFMNSEGGVLYIGVTDDKKIFGLEADIMATGKGNADGLLLHLDNLIKISLGVDKQHYLNHTIGKLEGKEVIRLEVKPAPKEVWLTFDKKEGKGKQEEFYIRGQAGSEALNGKALANYVRGRF
jgi:hypothetical protein